MPISILRNNLQLQFQSVVSLFILDIYFTVRYYRTEVVSTLPPKRLQYPENITMGNETQVKSRGRVRYRLAPNWVSLQKLHHHKKISFQQQHPQAQRCHLHTRLLIWRRKIWGLYLNPHQIHPTRILCRHLPCQLIREDKVPDLVIPIKPTKNNN